MLISVIIPVYNDEKYIKKCLSSIANQTFKNIEVIVVDDGSTDKSGKICEEFKSKDNRFKVIHKGNRGVSDSRNKGLDEASGDYICFVDSDDWIESNYFEQIAPILSLGNYSIIFNPFIEEKNNGQFCLNAVSSSMELICEDALSYLFHGKLFPWGVYSTFYKRELVKNIKFNLTSCFGEDFEFKYNAIKQAKDLLFFSSISKYHYVYREDSSVAVYSILKKSNDLEIIKNVMRVEKKRLKDILLFEQYFPRLITYALIGCNSSVNAELQKGKELRDEVAAHKWKILFSRKISLVLKIKMLVLLLPKVLRRRVHGIYINLKRVNGLLCKHL